MQHEQDSDKQGWVQRINTNLGMVDQIIKVPTDSEYMHNIMVLHREVVG